MERLCPFAIQRSLRRSIKEADTPYVKMKSMAFINESTADQKKLFESSQYQVLNIPVSKMNLAQTVSSVLELAHQRKNTYLCALNVHSVTLAQYSAELFNTLSQSEINCPDGMPLVWIGRMGGDPSISQVRGPDLMLEICQASVPFGFRHFLFGGKSTVAEKLKQELEKKIPGIQVVGAYTPPFRPMTELEEKQLKQMVDKTKPHFFWVGLGSPKQELFCARYVHRLDAGVMVGVGAAFDIFTGSIKDSPIWVRKIGLQWLHRLLQEPKRLWKRYLILNPLFLLLVVKKRLKDKISGNQKSSRR